VDLIRRAIPGSYLTRCRFDLFGTLFEDAGLFALASLCYLPDFSGISSHIFILLPLQGVSGVFSSGIIDIYSLLGEIENFLGTVPVRDMRTVSAVSVSVVTSVRLLRQHLMCHTGSFWPFRIRAAILWPLSSVRVSLRHVAAHEANRHGPTVSGPFPLLPL
jgi:hypothetical protein